MAVQNQPAVEPENTGEATIPVNPHFQPPEAAPSPEPDGSENGVDNVNFTDDEAGDITGTALDPLGFDYISRSQKRGSGFERSVYDWDEGNGIGPDHVIGVVKRTAEEALKRVSSFGDLHHHHDIYIFNHAIPVPIPITYFITDYNISETKRFPYTSGRIQLKLPYDLFKSIFTSTTGACSQPDTGSYIAFYKRKLDTADQNGMRNFTGTKENLTEIGLDMQCEHLGIVSGLSFNMAADQTTGQVITEATIVFSSFIHQIIEGQYRTTLFSIQDVEVDNRDYKGQYTIDKDYYEVPGSQTYYYRLNQYFQFVSEEIRAALGLPQAPPTKPKQSTPKASLPDWLRAPPETTRATAAPVRESIGDSMQRFLHAFGYPLVPPSLTLMPLDYIAYAYSVMRGGVTNVVESFQRFIAQGVPKEQVELLMRGTATALREYAKKTTDLYDINRDEVTEARQLDEIAAFDPSDVDLLDLPNAKVADAAERQRRWDAFIKEKASLSLRVGDIVKVASCKKDVPPTSCWREMLPAEAPFFKDFNRIRTLKSKSKSIFGLLYSTFVPNEELFEIFPVLMPLSLDDIDPSRSQENYQVGPIHARLGVVPTLIYRMKPLVPGFTITENMINQSLERQSRYQTGKGIDPSMTVLHKPQIESAGICYGQQSYYDHVFGTAKEKDPKFVSGPYVLRLADVINLSMNWSDQDRINGTYVEIPGTQSIVDKARYGMMSFPVIHGQEALKHGLRIKEYDYPFIDPTVVSTTKSPGNLATSMAEYAYVVNAQGQNFASGSFQVRYQGSHTQFIQPGMWIAIDMFPSQKDENQTNFQNLTGQRIHSTYSPYSEYMFLCLVESVNINLDIDAEGHEVLMMSIGYSRGSKGSEIPAYPSENFNGNEKVRDDYVFNEAIEANQADISGSQTPQTRQISQAVLDIISRPEGPARGATKRFTGEVQESLLELMRQEPLEEQYKMFVREKIIEDTPANYTKYVTNKEPFPQDNYDEVILLIDQLLNGGNITLDQLDPKLKALYEAASQGDDFYFGE